MPPLTKSPTSILFKLKHWLTLPEAAKHLSGICGEEITESDVLHYAALGHLKLSVTFDTPTWAHYCHVVHYDVAKLEDDIAKNKYPEILNWREYPSGMELISLNLGEGKFLNVENNYLSINGLFDLPKFGSAWVKVEQKWRNLTGEPQVDKQKHDGTFLEGYGGVIYRLKDGINFSHYQENYLAQQRDLKRQIAEKNIGKENAEILLNQLAEEREAFLKETHKADLPKDSILVVRTDALREFEQLISDNDHDKNTPPKTHGNTERHAQKREQILGAAFAVLARWPEECRDTKGDPIASKIASMIDAKADLFWPDAKPPLEIDSIAEHLRDWIKKANSRRK